MSALPPIDPGTADAELVEAPSRARKTFDGATPNLTRVMATCGDVDERIVDAARAAGVTDPEITEGVAHMAAQALTNYFGTGARVGIDLPLVSPRAGAA